MVQVHLTMNFFYSTVNVFYDYSNIFFCPAYFIVRI